ncbi:hypothetical protein KUL118_06630 [Tenacibaculum sp. KUL118]|nr:hypothetical protein KUL118_06630 [Tenacibaculum sp. KUL118]
MKNTTIKMTLIGLLSAGAFGVSSAPLSTLYVEDYYELFKNNFYTVSVPPTSPLSKAYTPEPAPVRPILPGPISPKKPVVPETPPPVQDAPKVDFPQGGLTNAWPSAYRGTWALKVQPFSQNSGELLMMRVIDGERIDIVAQDGVMQIGLLSNVNKGLYTISTVSLCECASSNVAYTVNSYSVSFNQYDEIEGEFTAYHYTADGTLVSDESGDVTGTLFDFITGR